VCDSVNQFRQLEPIGSWPEALTALALLALPAPNASDTGQDGKAAREKGLKWLRAANPDDEPHVAALRLLLWRRLGLPATGWEPLVTKLRRAHNAGGGWGQTKGSQRDACVTGQGVLLPSLARQEFDPQRNAARSGNVP
jgi:hypothetical protein